MLSFHSGTLDGIGYRYYTNEFSTILSRVSWLYYTVLPAISTFVFGTTNDSEPIVMDPSLMWTDNLDTAIKSQKIILKVNKTTLSAVNSPIGFLGQSHTLSKAIHVYIFI